MNEIETGGPAFPVTINGPCECFGLEANEGQALQFHGATLRDYFAAKAMAAIISADTQWTLNKSAASKMSFDYADSMLEARK